MIRTIEQSRTHRSIVCLDEQLAAGQLFDDPTLDERLLRVIEPDVSLSREIILAFDSPHRVVTTGLFVGLDELCSKRT